MKGNATSEVTMARKQRLFLANFAMEEGRGRGIKGGKGGVRGWRMPKPDQALSAL